MEDSTHSMNDMEVILLEKRQQINKELLPRLKTEYIVFKTSFSGIYDLVKKKGLVNEDPYKYEQKSSEIQIPPREAFKESEKADQISLRISSFDSQLEFLCTYYQFSSEFLNFQRIALLRELNSYFQWNNLSPNSSDVNTRVFGEILDNIKKGSDKMATDYLMDTENQIRQSLDKIEKILSDYESFHKELYKTQIRKELLSPLNIKRDAALERPAKLALALKKKMSQALPHMAFHKELIIQAIEEHYSPESNQSDIEKMEKMKVRKEKQKEDPEKKIRESAFECLRGLNALSNPLTSALVKTQGNNEIFQNQKVPFGERIKRFFIKMAGGKNRKISYHLEIPSMGTGRFTTKTVDLTLFSAEVRKRIQVLSAISNKASNTYKSMETKSLNTILEAIDKNLSDVRRIHEIFEGFDAFFKTETPREDRARIKGIKIELTTLKNNLGRCRQKQHETLAQQEELQQLKNLGIDPAP